MNAFEARKRSKKVAAEQEEKERKEREEAFRRYEVEVAETTDYYIKNTNSHIEQVVLEGGFVVCVYIENTRLGQEVSGRVMAYFRQLEYKCESRYYTYRMSDESPEQTDIVIDISWDE